MSHLPSPTKSAAVQKRGCGGEGIEHGAENEIRLPARETDLPAV